MNESPIGWHNWTSNPPVNANTVNVRARLLAIWQNTDPLVSAPGPAARALAYEAMILIDELCALGDRLLHAEPVTRGSERVELARRWAIARAGQCTVCDARIDSPAPGGIIYHDADCLIWKYGTPDLCTCAHRRHADYDRSG